jgi:putative lipoprotein
MFDATLDRVAVVFVASAACLLAASPSRARQAPPAQPSTSQQPSSQQPVPAGVQNVTGTVSYHARIAPPPNAVLVVQLQDVTLADAPAAIIAEFKTKIGGRRVPVPFKLTFDATKIDSKHSYAVEASILKDGQLLFTNDTLYPVLTQGHSARSDLILKPVPAPTSPKP